MQDRAIATPHLLKYNILVEFMSLRIVRAFIGQTRPGAARRRGGQMEKGLEATTPSKWIFFMLKR